MHVLVNKMDAELLNKLDIDFNINFLNFILHILLYLFVY